MIGYGKKLPETRYCPVDFLYFAAVTGGSMPIMVDYDDNQTRYLVRFREDATKPGSRPYFLIKFRDGPFERKILTDGETYWTLLPVMMSHQGPADDSHLLIHIDGMEPIRVDDENEHWHWVATYDDEPSVDHLDDAVEPPSKECIKSYLQAVT